jgi:hypothetical protein
MAKKFDFTAAINLQRNRGPVTRKSVNLRRFHKHNFRRHSTPANFVARGDMLIQLAPLIIAPIKYKVENELMKRGVDQNLNGSGVIRNRCWLRQSSFLTYFKAPITKFALQYQYLHKLEQLNTVPI